MRILGLNNILNYLAVFIVFSGAFVYNSAQFLELRGAYFIMGLVLFFWLPLINDIVFNKVFFVPFAVILIFSLYNVSRGLDTLQLFTKQGIGIFVNALWFYMLIKINNYDIKRLFRIYLNIAFVVAVIGVIQEISYLLNFHPGYDYKAFLPFWGLHPNQAHSFLRVNSILPEPAGLCVSMLPALFASLVTFFKSEIRIISRFKAAIIIIAFVFSFSSTGYIGLFIAIFLASFCYKGLKHILIAIFLILSVSLFLYNGSNDFKLRVDDSLKVVRTQEGVRDVNFSTFVLYSSAKVAYYSFKIAPLIGSGLGSFELSYRKFIPKLEGTNSFNGSVIIKDAASLFLRLVSETGLLGLVFVFIFVLKYFLGIGKNEMGYYWIINSSAFLVILIRLLRVGHYFTDGFFLFFWMYYFSCLQARGARREMA